MATSTKRRFRSIDDVLIFYKPRLLKDYNGHQNGFCPLNLCNKCSAPIPQRVHQVALDRPDDSQAYNTTFEPCVTEINHPLSTSLSEWSETAFQVESR